MLSSGAVVVALTKVDLPFIDPVLVLPRDPVVRITELRRALGVPMVVFLRHTVDPTVLWLRALVLPTSVVPHPVLPLLHHSARGSRIAMTSLILKA